MVSNGLMLTRRFGLEKTYTIIFTVPFVLEAVFLLINDYTIIPSFLDNDSVIWRTFIRNVVHPVYYGILVLILRNCAKRMHSDRAVVVTLMPLFFKAFFGRFFSSEMNSYGLVVLNSFLSVLLDIGVRLVHWNRHKLFERLSVRYPETWNKEKKILRWVFDEPEGDVFYGQFLNYEKAHEIVGIFFSLSITFVYNIYSYHLDNMPNLFVLLAIQISIEFVGQIVISLLEYYFNVPILNSTRHFKEFMPIFMWSCFVGAIFCAFRGYRVVTGQWFHLYNGSN